MSDTKTNTKKGTELEQIDSGYLPSYYGGYLLRKYDLEQVYAYAFPPNKLASIFKLGDGRYMLRANLKDGLYFVHSDKDVLVAKAHSL